MSLSRREPLKALSETQRRALLLFISVVISFVAAEGILRLLGFQPWSYLSIDRNEPSIFEYDSVLGWKPREGRYIIPPYNSSGSEIHVSILKTGLRKTYENQSDIRDSRPKIIFVGCSFTMGWAISDFETFPWKIQKHFPSFEVLNYGVGGYGTYQSLLLLERVLPEMHDPHIIVYGFIENHEDRNVATGVWMEWLSSFARRSHVYFPYVTSDKSGKLYRRLPEKYPTLPFREDLAVVALAEKALARFETFGREKQGRAVTQQLMLEMKELCARHGVEFAVALFDYGDEVKSDYLNFMKKNEIGAIDCFYPRRDDLVVPGEGHPNGKANSLWAECISDYLKKEPNFSRQ